ncbi:MAG TPA: hypothetical protein VGI10_18060 [Polyangiaceae bacterium]|jgi:hypothetical protein
MFDVIACEEFESWYKSLPEANAESVSSAVDVLAELGPALGPPRSSELLLWFDGVPGMGRRALRDDPREWLENLRAPTAPAGVQDYLRLRFGSGQKPADAKLEAQSQNLWQLLAWKRRSLSLFDSARFRARLGALAPDAAAAVLRGVEQVRRMLKQAREELVRVNQTHRDLFGEIDKVVDAVLTTAGLALADPALHAPGLRELRVAFGSRLARVIYGLDPSAERALLLLGEPLERAYYGDSVRRAETRFAEYLAGEYLKQAATAGGAQP